MAETYARHAGPTGGYLVARRFEPDFSEAWFEPGCWGAHAVPVTKGGRGSAWFIEPNDLDPLVLRHFCRGGLPGRFIRREYLFTGENKVRSFSEFRLLDGLYQQGLPVPEPVAADFTRCGKLFYRARILVCRIPDTRPLAEFTNESDVETWAKAGACVRRFHDSKVYHADLNCMNILVADRVYLIDFDRGRLMNRHGGGWKSANIRRLERSVEKFFLEARAEVKSRLWRSFLNGYESGSP